MRWRWGLGLAILGIGAVLSGRARAAVVCGGADSTGTEGCKIDHTIDPQALCNDGSRPVFSYRPGVGHAAKTWIIWLEGGGSCFNDTSCQQRWFDPTARANTTSIGWVPVDGSGIGSPNPLVSPLSGATTIVLHYCTSDYWNGTKTLPGRTFFDPLKAKSWRFDGLRVARADMKSLAELPGFSAARRIILGGSSAGGVGVTLDANILLPLLPSQAQTVLLNDAGFALDIGQFDRNAPSPYIFPGTPNGFSLVLESEMAAWHAHGNTFCAKNAKTQAQQVNCDNSSYLIQNRFIPVPVFVAESQLDNVQLRYQLCPLTYGECALPTDPASPEGIYAAAFGAAMAGTLVDSPALETYGVVSPDLYAHVILFDTQQFLSPFPVSGGTTNARTALMKWLANPTGPRQLTLGNGPGI